MSRPTARRFDVLIRGDLRLSVVEYEAARAAGDAAARARSAPLFLLVHGMASNARVWDGVGQALAGAGHVAYAVDLRGHGRSSKPDDGYDVATVADDVCELIGRLTDGAVVLAGQSWGGNVVLEAAARCPARVAAVAGIDGGAIRLADAYPEWERCAEELAPPPIAGMPAEALERRIREAHPDWPESGIVGTLANFEVRPDGTVAPWLTRERHMRVLRGLWEHDPAAVYVRVAMPSLLVAAGAGPHGAVERRRDDWKAEAEAMLPQGAIVTLPGADHDIHAQLPGRTADLLLGLARRARVLEPT